MEESVFSLFILNLGVKSGILDVRQDAFLHEFLQNLNPSLTNLN